VGNPEADAGGHLPPDGWDPDLELGSSRFHHYQSLPHILTGYVATVIGSERAVAWSLYLLLSFWPFASTSGFPTTKILDQRRVR